MIIVWQKTVEYSLEKENKIIIIKSLLLYIMIERKEYETVKKEILNLVNKMTMKEIKNTIIYKKLPKELRKSYQKKKSDLIDIIIEYVFLCEEIKYMNENFPEHSIPQLNKLCKLYDFKKKEKDIKKSVKGKKESTNIIKLYNRIKSFFNVK